MAKAIDPQTVCAIVVTYHPEKGAKDRIHHLAKFLGHVYVVDNGSFTANELFDGFRSKESITLIENSKNLGIATALNIGVRQGIQAGYQWFLTLDQDTNFTEETFEKMRDVFQFLKDQESVGMLAPVHFDAKTGYQSRSLKRIKGKYTTKEIVMTSGNLIPRSTFDRVGFYDDELFIEYVDHDFCLRVKKAGLQTYLVKDARIAHSLGNVKVHRFGPLFFFSHNYHAVRRYYRARNRMILYRRHPGWWILQDHEFFMKDLMKILLVEKDKWAKFKANFEGIMDAIQGRFGSYDNRENYVPTRLLHKYSVYNLAGHALPLLVGFLTIPQLMKSLGLEKFGLLTLIWAVIGYFSIFDFGLSRTITVKLAQLSAKKQFEEMNLNFWTSMKFIFYVTLLGSILMVLASRATNFYHERFSAELLYEGILSLQIMALTLPAITLTAGIKGALEAESKFLQLNLAQSMVGTLNFLIPTIMASKDDSLHYIVLALSILRYIFLGIHFLMLRKSPWLKKMKFMTIREGLPLVTSGGWFTVTNIIGPVFVYLDRLILAFLIPPSALAYYTTSSEVVNRLQIFPFSIARAVFPSLASATETENLNALYKKAFTWISVLCGSIILVGLSFGKWGLTLWLGADFAHQAFTVFSILLVGFFMNALAWSPFSLIQALNRPDLSARAHLIELPVYCASLFVLVKSFGIVGAAIAWSLRTTLDFILMTFIANRLKKNR